MLVEKKIHENITLLNIPFGSQLRLCINKQENAKYNWYIKYDNCSNMVQLSEESDSLITPELYKEKRFQYICIVCNGENEEKYIIDVNIVKVFFEIEPIKQKYLLGEPVYLQVDLNKKIEKDMSINWQEYNAENEKWEYISDDRVLEIIPKEPKYENRSYRAIVKFDEFESVSKIYDVSWDKIITKQPTAKAILFNDEKIQLAVEVVEEQANNVKYAWQYKEGDGNWQYIENATKPRYTVYSRLLECVITDIRCEIKLDDHTVYSNETEVIHLKRGKHAFVVEPARDAIKVCAGESVDIEVIVRSEEPMKYRWEKKNGNKYVSLPSKYNDTVLRIDNVQKKDEGLYRCIVFDEEEVIVSEDISLEVTSNYKEIKADIFMVVDRDNDKLCYGQNIYHNIAFNGLMHFEHLLSAIEKKEEKLQINSAMENAGKCLINNLSLKNGEILSVKDLIYADIFQAKNDAIDIINSLFKDTNREHKLVDLYGNDEKVVNVSLIRFANIINEFIKNKQIYKIIWENEYNIVNSGNEKRKVINDNLDKIHIDKCLVDLWFKTFKCGEEVLSVAISKDNFNKEYLIITVTETDEKCMRETVNLYKYVLD